MLTEEFAQLVPLIPEPIIKQDGANKNDCERNAAKRFITKLRQDHPHLPLIVTEDSLSSNAPHITVLRDHNIQCRGGRVCLHGNGVCLSIQMVSYSVCKRCRKAGDRRAMSYANAWLIGSYRIFEPAAGIAAFDTASLLIALLPNGIASPCTGN